MALKPTGVDHEALYQDLIKLLGKHAVTAVEMLAVASNIVGKILAMQDQRVMSLEVAKVTIARNIEYGNAQVLEQLLASKGSG